MANRQEDDASVDEVTLTLLERVERLEQEKAQLLRTGGRHRPRSTTVLKVIAGVSLVAAAALAVNVVMTRQSASDARLQTRRDVGEWGTNRPWNFNSENQVDGFSPLLGPARGRRQRPPNRPGNGNGNGNDDDWDEEVDVWPPGLGHGHGEGGNRPHVHANYPSELDIKYQGVQYDDNNPECTGLGLFKGTFPDMDYGFMGYNVLLGYPLQAGHDPGFTLPIFAADYTDGFQTADCLWSIPQGYILLPDVSCVTSFSSDVITSSRALSESLETKAKVSGKGWGAKFSASAGYQESSSSLESGESVYIVSRAECNYYYMKLKEYDLPPFDDLFIEWIVKLNNTDDDNTYLEFFANYGTHYIEEAKFGATFTYEYQMDSSTYESEVSSGVDVAVSASYSGVVKVGASASLTTSEAAAASDFQSKTTSSTITIGAAPPSDGDTLTWASEVKENPLPTEYSLASIEDLFTETFMGPGTLMENYTIDYDAINSKIEDLKKTYCEQLKSEGLLDDCSDLVSGVTLDNTRLTGTYTEYADYASSGDCIDLCDSLSDCEGVDYCDVCDSDDEFYRVCRVYTGNVVEYGTYDEDWESTLLLPNVDVPIILRDTSLSAVERALNDDTINNTYDCYAECADDDYCIAFSFCPCEGLTQKCYLYSETVYNLETTADTTTYFLSDDTKRSTFLLFSLNTDESLYAGPYCEADVDCQMSNMACYDNACLCTAGYYFSISQDACVSSCDEASLQDYYMGPYTDYLLDGHNATSATTVQECLDDCKAASNCHSFSTGGSTFECTIADETARTDSANFGSSSGHAYYQRVCE